MLKLPQITLSTASVYLHRFFMRHPMVADKQAPQRPFHHYYSVAAACLFLATKVSPPTVGLCAGPTSDRWKRIVAR